MICIRCQDDLLFEAFPLAGKNTRGVDRERQDICRVCKEELRRRQMRRDHIMERFDNPSGPRQEQRHEYRLSPCELAQAELSERLTAAGVRIGERTWERVMELEGVA